MRKGNQIQPAIGKTVLLTALLSFLIAGVCKADQISIVADGKSDYVIALAEKGVDETRIKKAAQFLQETIKKSTGAVLPIMGESKAKGKPAIYLGWSEMAKKAEIDVKKYTDWSYLNRTVGKNIFLVGQDRETKIKPGNRQPVTGVYGSFKAVTAFLDDQMGVKFLMPGDYGTFVPKAKDFKVDSAMNKSWKPLFKYLSGRMSNYYPRNRNHLGNTAFGFATHMFGPSEFMYTYGGHSYYTAVPKDKYEKTNPEYFAEKDGVRSSKGNHLCISNAEVQELMLKELEHQFDRGFEWVELEQTDGYIPCQCSGCQKIHPDPKERVWIVHRKLAAEMQKRRPGKTVMMSSYQPTRLPPKSFNTFPDNVAIRLTRYRPRDFEIWEEWGGKHIPKSLYTTNWFSAHPRVTSYVVVEQNRLFLKHNIKGMYLCGGIIENGKGNWYPWGLGGPGYYAFFKSLHNPDVDPVEMRGEYVNAAFGKAAAPMQNFFAALEDRMDHFWWLFRADPENSPPSRMAQTAGDVNTQFYPPRTLKVMTESLARAMKNAEEERVKAMLKLVKLEFEYLKTHALVHHFYKAYRLAPSWTTLELLEKKVKNFKDTRKGIWPDGKPVKVKGLPGPFSGTLYKYHRQIAKGAPFNWNFDILREKKLLPGTGIKKVDVMPVTAFELDGKLDNPEWANIPFQEIGEISLGKAPSKTQFKLAYGKNFIYIGFKAEMFSPEGLANISSVGKDGTAWRQENMEFVIDPLGSRRMYYHFIVNPAKNSTLDRRFGYHKAPDHPLYRMFEWDWNGKWEYAFNIADDKKSWTAELKIPYETLEAKVPERGDVWTMNIGRNEYGSTKGKENARKKHEIVATYLWSPNIESKTFHDISAFGELNFK
ncbi:MAG: DUF4838 domain-containing protein [Planctomycetota bacterium]|jgi:hypothetical protein